MKAYQEREKITLAFSTRGRKKYVEVKFGGDDIRLLLSKEQGVLFDNNRAYPPVDCFVLSDFFERYVEQAFIDFSQIIEAPKKKQVVRINAIKFYYEKVLGQERRCYKVHRAKREKTLPDVLSKEEIKSFLAVASVDIRFYCMYSILYSAGLRINELLSLKPDDIDVSRSLIHVRQGKGKKDRYTLLSKPLVGKLSEYRARYNPETWLFERETGVQFSESIVSKKLKEIALEAGITKRVYPHLFRHSFATHLIEQGTDLKIVQELLGHNNIKTTEVYVHIADTYKSKIKSPLDDILTEETL